MWEPQRLTTLGVPNISIEKRSIRRQEEEETLAVPERDGKLHSEEEYFLFLAVMMIMKDSQTA
jgi:hypothetical protein